MKTLENTPQAEKKPKFNLKSKKLKIVAIVLVGVVALGGVAGALVIKSIKNRPENVAAKSISNYLFGLKDGGKQKMTIKVSSADNPMANVELGLDAITTKDLGAAQLNFEASVSAFRLRGMIQVAENGNLYIKLKDLPLLLNSASGVQTGLPPEMVSQIETLGEKWIEITQDDIKSLSGNTVAEDNECTAALGSAVSGDELGGVIDDTYTSNMFMTAKSSSEEVVDGKKLLKVEVGLDKEAAKKFGEDLKKNELVRAIADKCRDQFKSSGAEDSANDVSDDLQNGKLTIWADRAKKQLVKLEASGDMVTDGQKTGTMSLVIEPGKGEASIEEIKDEDKVNIKELMAMFGIDPTMLSGLVPAV